MPAKFAEIDADGSGEVDYQEFCDGFSFEQTALTQKLFDAFDQDLSGQISVLEFIAGLSNWQSFSQKDKMKFTYKIYDLDGSGFVEPEELDECLCDTNVTWRDENSMGRIIQKIMKTLRDANIMRIKLSDFVTLSKKYPSVLFLPLFALMEQIFTIVEIDEKDNQSGMSDREKRTADRNSRRQSTASQPGSADSRTKTSRRGSKS